ncbi:MAG: c-type cytochrome [Blastocatellia bacterium]|jgi:mono/diheme cytochrome c family protein
MSRNIKILAAMVIGFAVMLFVITPTDTLGQAKDPNERGRRLYAQYCASCHGMDGKGAGPVAASLKVAPTDLTMIAKSHGSFDRLKVENSINGELNIGAHGSSEMPVWGAYFRKQRGQSVSVLNAYALMKYLEAIQVK